MTGVADHLAESRHAIGSVLRSRSLRRLNIALVGSVVGDWAFTVALSIYAYESGGVAALGALGAVRYVTMAVLAPFVAVLADTGRPTPPDGRCRRGAHAGSSSPRPAWCSPTGRRSRCTRWRFSSESSGWPSGRRRRPCCRAWRRTRRSSRRRTSPRALINSVGFFLGPVVAGLLLACSGRRCRVRVRRVDLRVVGDHGVRRPACPALDRWR